MREGVLVCLACTMLDPDGCSPITVDGLEACETHDSSLMGSRSGFGYGHQGLLGTPSQGLGIVGRLAVGRGRIVTFVVIFG